MKFEIEIPDGELCTGCLLFDDGDEFDSAYCHLDDEMTSLKYAKSGNEWDYAKGSKCPNPYMG